MLPLFQTLVLALAADPVSLDWKIDDVARQAIVFAPAEIPQEGAPLVFAFHGHGGTNRNVARSFGFQQVWPQAVVVYMQGLNTPGKTDPQGLKPGWQHGVGDQGDRDLKFFDAVLATLKEKYKIDARRIYATGHSNGGGFTYVLWSTRPQVFAAYAPSACRGAAAAGTLKPAPVMHVAGRQDPVVPFAGQEQTMLALRKLNGCDEQGEAVAKNCTLYPSKGGTPVVTMIHDGDHKYPAAAPALIVKFFQRHARPEEGAKKPE